MCVAIVKPKGQNIPDKSILQSCFNHNDDGAGFAFEYQGKVQIFKGYMTFDSFYTAINQADEIANLKEKNVLIHFRLGTSGGISREMTHPFPISCNKELLRSTALSTDYAFIHNGIYDTTAELDMSDTAVFVRDYVYPLSCNKDWLQNKELLEIIYRLGGNYNKFAVLDSEGNYYMSPNFQLEDGIYYSNLGWKTSLSWYQQSLIEPSIGGTMLDDLFNDNYESSGLFDGLFDEDDANDANDEWQIYIPENPISMMRLPNDILVSYIDMDNTVRVENTGILSDCFVDENQNLYWSTSYIKQEKPENASFYKYGTRADYYNKNTMKPIEFHHDFYVNNKNISTI